MRVLATVAVASVLCGLVGISVRTVYGLRAERLVEQELVQRKVGGVDFYFEGLDFKQYNGCGCLVQRLKADLVEHCADHNHFDLVRPVFTFFHSKEQPWVIAATYGKSSNGREVVHLSKKVKITRARGEYNSKVQVDTDRLRVYTHQRTAETDQEVSFLEGANLMRGVGANIDFNKGVIKLASQIQMWYKLNF